MLTASQVKWLYRSLQIIILLGLVSALYGYFETESDMQDNERIQLFNQAFKDGYIIIDQPGAGEPLQPSKVAEFVELQGSDPEKYGKERWNQMRRQVLRFIAAVNQGLGDPFTYEEQGGRSFVVGIVEQSLKYQNPFTVTRRQPITTPINSSEAVARRRPGWRVVSKNTVLYLKPEGEQVTTNPASQPSQEIGGEFILTSAKNPGATLKLSTEGQGKLQVLKLLASRKAEDQTPSILTLRHGGYYVWDGLPYAVFRTDMIADNAGDATVGDLVFTKNFNGKPLRVQVLGRATANLIGSPVGGETRYIDGALKHEQVQRLILTIDSDIQTAAFNILRKRLEELDGQHPAASLKRGRYGALTVLDTSTGQVLAHAGVPGYDPEWEGSRVVLANRYRLTLNNANLTHMPGSAIKIFTGGVGYLLYGEGTGTMLPRSINKYAIRQAFRNVYGGPMPPENIVENTSQADVTPQGEEYFKQFGNEKNLKNDFRSAINSAFFVREINPDNPNRKDIKDDERKAWRENLIPRDLDRYFDAKAKYDFFPDSSRFPVAEANSLEIFRHFALGGNEAKFTTLRLAAILDTVTSGRIMHPFIVESVVDPAINNSDNRATYKPASVFDDFRVLLPNLEGANNGNIQKMSYEMTKFLQLVVNGNPFEGRPGTGYYYNSKGAQVFMTQDDSTTPEDESTLRKDDLGKTGTADLGKVEQYFDDSIFVYKHGKYAIAVWLERADGQGVEHPANWVVDQLTRFIDKLEPTRQ